MQHQHQQQCCLEGRLIKQMHDNVIEPPNEHFFDLDGRLKAFKLQNSENDFVCYIGREGLFENGEEWALVYYWPSKGGTVFKFASHSKLELLVQE